MIRGEAVTTAIWTTQHVPVYDPARTRGALFYAMKCVQGTPWDRGLASGRTAYRERRDCVESRGAIALPDARGVIHGGLQPKTSCSQLSAKCW